MAQETRNWRDLCWAIINEQNPEKVAELVQRLLVVLEDRKSKDWYSEEKNAIWWLSANRDSGH
jgi:hypothetical protein